MSGFKDKRCLTELLIQETWKCNIASTPYCYISIISKIKNENKQKNTSLSFNHKVINDGTIEPIMTSVCSSPINDFE